MKNLSNTTKSQPTTKKCIQMTISLNLNTDMATKTVMLNTMSQRPTITTPSRSRSSTLSLKPTKMWNIICICSTSAHLIITTMISTMSSQSNSTKMLYKSKNSATSLRKLVGINTKPMMSNSRKTTPTSIPTTLRITSMMKALVMPNLMKTGSCNETQRIDSDDEKRF